MRFYVTSRERDTVDPQETRAMLKHRLKSIKYLQLLYKKPIVDYILKSTNGKYTYLMINIDSLKELDVILKLDPIWPYSKTITTPTISSKDMVLEIQKYLGEEILSLEFLKKLEPKRVHIKPNSSIYLAGKHSGSFSPLLPDEEQNEIYRRTIISQKLHNDPMELHDVNPVGMAAGILLIQANSEKEVRKHVSKSPIYLDTNVKILKLDTLEQSYKKSLKILKSMGEFNFDETKK